MVGDHRSALQGHRDNTLMRVLTDVKSRRKDGVAESTRTYDTQTGLADAGPPERVPDPQQLPARCRGSRRLPQATDADASVAAA